MKGYKAFEKGLICKGKQYAENTVFEEDEAVVCKKGMHFCKEPLDVLDYYDLVDKDGNIPEFAEVEALEDPLTDDNKKYCTKKLRIGAKISLAKFIQCAVDIIFQKCNTESVSSGDRAKLASSGDYSIVMSSGRDSIAKANVGSWITLSEWHFVDGKFIPVCVKTEKVDGKRIKADTWYQLKDEEFVEVK